VDDAAARKRRFEPGERRVDLVNAARNFGLRCHVDVVFRKVDAGLEQSNQLHQRLLRGRCAAAERAAHLAGGLARLRQRLCIDQVANRFSLRQIKPPGQKSALGELSRLGQARAELECAAQQKLQHHGRAVRGNLDKIFRCIRIGCGEEGNQRLVDARETGARTFRICRLLHGARSLPEIDHVGQSGMSVLKGLMGPHEHRGNRRGFRPTQAHDSDAAPPRRRGDRSDGVSCGARFEIWRGHRLHSV
jgi:hypothetical protein